MVDPLRLALCVRRARRRLGDAVIRRRLSRTRLSLRLIEQAFRLASLMPERAGVKRSVYARGALLAGHIVWVAFLAGLWSLKLAAARPTDAGAASGEPAQASDYRPEPLAPPTAVLSFLPEQASGDAGPYYWKAGRLALAAFPRIWASGRINEAAHAAAIDALEKGTSLSEMRPSMGFSSADDLSERLATLAAASRAADVFRQRAERWAASGRWDLAEADSRRELAFGYHLLGQWEVPLQRLGLRHIHSAVDGLRRALASDGRYDGTTRGLLRRLEAQCRAYEAQDEELKNILGLARDPRKLRELEPYLSQERLLRPYAYAALAAAAFAWSPQEALRAESSVERRRFLLKASLAADERVRNAAKAHLRALRERQRVYAGLPERLRPGADVPAWESFEATFAQEGF